MKWYIWTSLPSIFKGYFSKLGSRLTTDKFIERNILMILQRNLFFCVMSPCTVSYFFWKVLFFFEKSYLFLKSLLTFEDLFSWVSKISWTNQGIKDLLFFGLVYCFLTKCKKNPNTYKSLKTYCSEFGWKKGLKKPRKNSCPCFPFLSTTY